MRQSGIYGIVNTVNRKICVGSSTDCRTRWEEHKRELSCNKHTNSHLQASWLKYGEASFEFRVLELCPEDMLIVREDSWMNYYHSLDGAFGYNMVNASRTVYTEEERQRRSEQQKGKHLSEEQKRRIGESVSKARTGLKVGHPFTDIARQHMSEAKKGEKNSNFGKHPSAETRAKIGLASATRSEETRRKLSESHKGIHASAESRQRRSERYRGKGNPNYGKHRNHTEETKQQISQTMKQIRSNQKLLKSQQIES